MKPNIPNEETCTTREAAQILGISLRTAQMWVERGVLQAWKTAGGHRRINLASVRKLLGERQQAAGTPDMQVLVVEDDLITLKMYQAVIAQWHLPMQFAFATNAYEGLLHIGRERPDVLITDLDLPGMDGFGMIRTLRAFPETRNMTIIVVTGLEAEAIRARGELPVGVPVLFKPVRFDVLKDMLQVKLPAIGLPQDLRF